MKHRITGFSSNICHWFFDMNCGLYFSVSAKNIDCVLEWHNAINFSFKSFNPSKRFGNSLYHNYNRFIPDEIATSVCWTELFRPQSWSLRGRAVKFPRLTRNQTR
jgi:hypothetical protein